MKEFFYLDQDLLDSYISQIFNGLIDKVIDENLNSHAETQENDQVTTEASLSGNIGVSKVPFLNALLSGSLKATTKDGQQLTAISDEFKAIVTKKMKDNLFVDLENHLKDEELICECNSPEEIIEKLKENPKVYFRLTEDFHFINLDRVDIMFQEKYHNIYRLQHPDSQDFPNSEYFLSVQESIKLLRELLPYKAFLYSGKYIVLLNEENMRIKKEVAGFKFDSKAIVLGRIRKTTLESFALPSYPKVIKLLNHIQDSTFTMLYEKGFVIEKPEYIVDPIAIYYE